MNDEAKIIFTEGGVELDIPNYEDEAAVPLHVIKAVCTYVLLTQSDEMTALLKIAEEKFYAACEGVRG